MNFEKKMLRILPNKIFESIKAKANPFLCAGYIRDIFAIFAIQICGIPLPVIIL